MAPVHVAMLLTMVVLALVVTRGPGTSMRAPTAASLPGPVVIKPDLPVGQATLPLRRKPVGMPSPAAAASIAVEGGGAAPASNTQDVRMKGIPSPAAAATLGPQTLPMRPSDGMTLPRTSMERDNHATERHYGGVAGGGGEPEALPARPVVTPGDATAAAQLHADMHSIDSSAYSAQPGIPNAAY